MAIPAALGQSVGHLLGDLVDLYRDVHTHPELSGQEVRTASLVSDWLRPRGWEVHEGVGGTGVVAILRNGEGPCVLLRADMDALPIRESTGLRYASTVTAVDADGAAQPVMHACGHDAHVTCLVGAASVLAEHRAAWTGSVMLVFQPAEETGAGARALVADRLFERFGRPDVCLAQHVSPAPAGHAFVRGGTAMASSDSLRVRLFGRGGHSSLPETTVDPVVMAAMVIIKLQTIVARTVAAIDAAVVTVASVHAGAKENVIPDQAELTINIRTFNESVRTQVLSSVTRIVEAESQSAGATVRPEISVINSFPVTHNDPLATQRVREALRDELGREQVHEAHPDPGSEDFGVLGSAAGVPSVMWFWGGHDPADFGDMTEFLAHGTLPAGIASQHSPQYAPTLHPTLEVGTRALLAAALAWVGNGH